MMKYLILIFLLGCQDEANTLISSLQSSPGTFSTSPTNQYADLALKHGVGLKCKLKMTTDPVCSGILYLGDVTYCIPSNPSYFKAYKIASYLAGTSAPAVDVVNSIAHQAILKKLDEPGDGCNIKGMLTEAKSMTDFFQVKSSLSGNILTNYSFAKDASGNISCVFKYKDANGLDRKLSLTKTYCTKAYQAYKKNSGNAADSTFLEPMSNLTTPTPVTVQSTSTYSLLANEANMKFTDLIFLKSDNTYWNPAAGDIPFLDLSNFAIGILNELKEITPVGNIYLHSLVSTKISSGLPDTSLSSLNSDLTSAPGTATPPPTLTNVSGIPGLTNLLTFPTNSATPTNTPVIP